MRERIKLCEMIKSYYIEGEKWQKILINIKENEIKQLEEQMTKGVEDFNTLIGKLSKKMGFGIDPRKTSVRQFYSYLKAL
jgi:hypothetical protein